MNKYFRKSKRIQSKNPALKFISSQKKNIHDSHCICISINNLFLYQSENSIDSLKAKACVNVFNLTSDLFEGKILYFSNKSFNKNLQ